MSGPTGLQIDSYDLETVTNVVRDLAVAYPGRRIELTVREVFRDLCGDEACPVEFERAVTIRAKQPPQVDPDSRDTKINSSSEFSYAQKPRHSAVPDEIPYEVAAFAEKHGLTQRAAEVLLFANGPSRVACDAAAKAFIQALEMRNKHWQLD
ncbi:hypothetical protein FJV76_13670 [Mesorhizobium sp. WSM4303]|uniref:hypothetical protein n=1 Tax=unclassified Mesorhizobium TaxID=325217 RepID=UPI00115CAF24|nr:MULTISPECIES: hypothetical protein [unclassified Mesorhizobium]TRC98347.1 hypothetical protein FJV77_07780 [Mesorhizobium sp. WSM4306]TRD04324.1 hypothetical protein FJV76_13670 [Mesorhizobium sp. WSM4303]